MPTRGLTELELYIEGRPVEAAREIADDTHHLQLPRAGQALVVGRRHGVVTQRRLVE